MINNTPLYHQITNHHVCWDKEQPSTGDYIDRPIPCDDNRTQQVAPIGHVFASPITEQKARERLEKLQNDRAGSYFICYTADLSPLERLEKTQEAIYQISDDSTSSKIILDYFLSRLPLLNFEWTKKYLDRFTQDPILKSYIFDQFSLDPLYQLSQACNLLKVEDMPRAAKIFIHSLENPIEVAELRVKIDFTRIAARCIDTSLTIDTIFPEDEDLVISINTFLEKHKEKLQNKKIVFLPNNIQIFPRSFLARLPNVRSVVLSQGDFVTFPLKLLKNILDLPSLESLHFANNSFIDFPRGILDKAKKLKKLDLANNPLSKEVKASLRKYCQERKPPITLIL